ncbi:MAG TPA: MBL fold metallo-hydrolase [Syntrophales bacterium]|jgi:glyoxylase-like metal-dependent hydrolase (beta-lactamase superfamily II)|nr:MBL fold metallo-hydrolase [Syntrophales bacterium]HON22783.1 MBL fold metallo-hydrolase [Syntrophales bacterium]HOU77925.1 MBL fold metallo-hydrolase [Syntrophales bacterium]HPC32539.1 MBL fold metallo-hydrolase [Syntrophales bacterium]HQG34090.1 MBL fold metallo-hydrolase [Syntrophales bacterium]
MKIFDGCHAFIWNHYQENNCNTYLIDRDKKIVIDPGHEHLFPHVRQGLNLAGIALTDVELVLATHGHPDHLEGVREFRKPTLFAMNKDEYAFIRKLAGNYFQIPAPDFFLEEGDFSVGSESFRIIRTPGHSPASICLYWPSRKVLFTGDVVFNQGIGRTDLPGGSGKLLKDSIARLAELDVEYLLAGHGEPVIGRKAVEANFNYIRDYWFPYLTAS